MANWSQPRIVLVLSDDGKIVELMKRVLNQVGIYCHTFDGHTGTLSFRPVGLVTELDFSAERFPIKTGKTPPYIERLGIYLSENPSIPILGITNFALDKENHQLREQFTRSYLNEIFFCSKAGINSSLGEFVRAVLGSALEIPFSFGAVIRAEGPVADGQLIRLVEPAYLALVQAIGANPGIIYQIDPREWEEIIAGSYEKAGFDEIVLTPRSGDLGRDIVAIKRGFGSIKFIEQVKAYKPGHKVGADEVRALLGVLHAERDASKAIFSTTSEFAPRLRQDRFIAPYMPHRLELIDRDALLGRLALTLR